MKKDKAAALLEKYHHGTCTEQERAAVEAWYNFHGKASSSAAADEDLEERKELIWNSIAAAHQGRVVKFPVWRYATVAAAAAVIALCVYFFNANRHREGSTVTKELLVKDIAPGRNGATITLANGKVIALNGAKKGVVVGTELRYEDNTLVGSGSAEDNTTNEAQYLMASTAKGQTYQFTLPDGTKVWLNADSKISFPSQFSEKERKIILSGEGYFEVSKDKTHPFIVSTERQQIEVLGTHFNVSAYADDIATSTTLLEGRVKVRDEYDMHILTPGTQAYNGLDGMRVRNADVDMAVAWKEGKFMFDHEPLAQILQKVARWYNVSVDYENKALGEESLSGTVSRFDNMSIVLKRLEMTGGVKFSLKGRTITVKSSKGD